MEHDDRGRFVKQSPIIPTETPRQRKNRLHNEWYSKNKESLVARRKELMTDQDRQEHQRLKSKEWYARNAEYRKYAAQKARKWRDENKDRCRELSHKWLNEHRKERLNYRDQFRAFLENYKMSRGCLFCGYNLHPSALHFHHTNGKKENIISHIGSISGAIKEIEYGECIIVCANCHSIISHAPEFWEMIYQEINYE